MWARFARMLVLGGATLAVASTIGVFATILDKNLDPAPTVFYLILAGAVLLGLAFAAASIRSFQRGRVLDAVLVAGSGWVSLLVAMGRFDVYDWYMSIFDSREYGYHLWIPTVGVIALLLLLSGSALLTLSVMRRLRSRGLRVPGEASPVSRVLVVVGLGCVIAAAVGTGIGLDDWYPDIWYTDLAPRGLYALIAIGVVAGLFAMLTTVAGFALHRPAIDLLTLLVSGWAVAFAGLGRTEVYELYISVSGDFDASGPAWTRPVSLLGTLVLAVGLALLARSVVAALRRAEDPSTPEAPTAVIPGRVPPPPPPPPSPSRLPEPPPPAGARLGPGADEDFESEIKRPEPEPDFDVTIRKPGPGPGKLEMRAIGVPRISLLALFAVGFLALMLLVPRQEPARAEGETRPTDVLLLFDTTGSMSDALSSAVERVHEITSRLEESIGNVGFAVAEVRDYDLTGTSSDLAMGDEGDVPFSVAQPVTTDIGKVSDALESLEADGGGDGPEAYGRALRDAVDSGDVGWREGSRKTAVVIADDVPHDDYLNEGIPSRDQFPDDYFDGVPDPGHDEEPYTADDIDWQSTLDDMAEFGLPIMYLLFSGDDEYLPYWRIWTKRTGGSAELGDSASLEDKIVDLARKGASAEMPDCPVGLTRDGSFDRTCIQDKSICPDVLTLGLRGSGQDAGKPMRDWTMGNIVGDFNHLLGKRLKSEGLVYKGIPIKYPAVAVGHDSLEKLWNSLDAANRSMFPGSYDASVHRGRELLWQEMQKWLHRCGDSKVNTRIVVAGYSQGAQVAGDVFGWKSMVKGRPESDRRRIVGALFADPKSNNDDKEAIRGGFTHSFGALGKRGTFQRPPKVFSFCRMNDFICGAGGPLSNPQHGKYKELETTWAANLVGNVIREARGDIGLSLEIGQVYEGDKGLKLPVKVKMNTPGTVQLEATIETKVETFRRIFAGRVLSKGGEVTLDLDVPREAQNNSQAGFVGLRLPTAGSGAQVTVKARASAWGVRETSAEAKKFRDMSVTVIA